MTAAAPTPTSAGTGATGRAPTVHLMGCAKTQDAVATTLVRLRAIHGSDEVDLKDSGKDLTTAGRHAEPAAARTTPSTSS